MFASAHTEPMVVVVLGLDAYLDAEEVVAAAVAVEVAAVAVVVAEVGVEEAEVAGVVAVVEKVVVGVTEAVAAVKVVGDGQGGALGVELIEVVVIVEMGTGEVEFVRAEVDLKAAGASFVPELVFGILVEYFLHNA